AVARGGATGRHPADRRTTAEDLLNEETASRELGPLSGVQTDALGWAFDLAKEETRLAKAELVIDGTSLSAYCPACSAERILQSDHELGCPVCGGPTPEIKTGRELEFVAVEIDP
ncbi:MAG: hydrogenase maturation nickel metallochaperone HypA, partial [Isosphaeraceae bacterium]